MVKLLGGRVAAAVIGLFMLGVSASAAAQDVAPATQATAVATTSGAVTQAQPAQSVTVKLQQSIAQEAAWLYKGGWPLEALVQKYATNAQLDEIKAEPRLSKMELIRQSRLSVAPVRDEEWKVLLELAAS